MATINSINKSVRDLRLDGKKKIDVKDYGMIIRHGGILTE